MERYSETTAGTDRSSVGGRLRSTIAGESSGWPGIKVSRHRFSAGEVRVSSLPGHLVTLHLSGPLRLVQLLDGRRREGTEIKGDVGIVPLGTDATCIFGNGSEDANLLLDDGFFRRVAAEAGMDEARLEIAGAFATRDPHIERIGLTFLSELEWGGPGEALYTESLANLLALHLVRHHSSVGRRAKARLDREASAGLPGSALKRAIEYVEDNLAGELTLEVLARAAGMSPSRFSRAFKRATGRTPHRYVVERRVERARLLLERGGLPIAEVAREVGFYDQSHLNRHFKRVLGLTPTQV
jgi:AraC family transcriptional regulator